MTEHFESFQDFDVTMDENGNIVITIKEHKEVMFQGFKLKAKRKRLRRLHEITAFNLAQLLEMDVESFNTPKTLIPLF